MSNTDNPANRADAIGKLGAAMQPRCRGGREILFQVQSRSACAGMAEVLDDHHSGGSCAGMNGLARGMARACVDGADLEYNMDVLQEQDRPELVEISQDLGRVAEWQTR